MPNHDRQSSYEVRFEMTPLLDVVFLLLTFFIYSMILTVQANVLPLNFQNVAAGSAAPSSNPVGITVDHTGQLFLNRKKITKEQLNAQLKILAKDSDQPDIYIGLENKSASLDRAPLLIDLFNTVRKLGFKKINIIGRPDGDKNPTP